MNQERRDSQAKNPEPSSSETVDWYTVQLILAVAAVVVVQQSPFREMTTADFRNFITVLAIALVLPVREVGAQLLTGLHQLSRESTQAQSSTVFKTADEIENGDD